MATTFICIFCVTSCTSENDPGSVPSFETISENGITVVVLRGISESDSARINHADFSYTDFADLIPIHVESAGEFAPPLLGEYKVFDDRIEFHPKFPFQHETPYRAQYDTHVFTFSLDSIQKKVQPVIAEIYPSVDTLPANLLKFYITFSAPMSRGYGYTYISLLDQNDEEVPDPFPSIGVELWNPDQTQFTLLLDPGRIKRGIAINESMGLPLIPGDTYRLAINEAWPTADGTPLGQTFEKQFRVVAPDYQSPDYQSWNVDKPTAQSADSVTVTFNESMDYSLSDRFIWIEDDTGEIIEGSITLQQNELQWSFKRSSGTWKSGNYAVGIHSRFEDLAGNQIEKPFEVDIQSQPARVAEIQTHTIPFTIN